MKAATSKIKTQWDLGSLFYRSLNDPELRKDVEQAKKAYRSFEKKYKDKVAHLSDDRALLRALRDWEKLSEIVMGQKPLRYCGYVSDLNASDKKASALANKLGLEIQEEANRVIFFILGLGSLPPSRQKAVLKNKRFAPYHYFLVRTFERAKHNLSEKEEQLMNLLDLPSSTMWEEGVSRAVASLTVLYKKQKLPIAKALGMIPDLPIQERRELHKKCMEVIWTIGDFAESEICAIYTAKKISDSLRKLPKPYSGTALRHQTGEQEIDALVAAVNKAFPIAHRFYHLKKQLLGVDVLTYADRGAKIGTLKQKMTFAESVTIVRDTFYELGEKYGALFDMFISEGRIDAYPKEGKRGGAYCSGGVGIPTLVLLNHVDTVRSLMTFAHEMGHAVHTELSKSQPPLYQGYSTAVAEVASTLFESIVFEKIWEKLSAQEQIIALHDRINDSISTVFRQIACFRYELAMHEAVRERGALSKEEMAAMHNTYMQEYLGKDVRMEKHDGAFFINWGHLRYYFYVYSYAYGDLISHALFARYKKDRSYLRKIEVFLSTGGSKAPRDIFKDAGIDVTDPAFFKEGLKNIEEDIKHLERLTKKK
jgi:oligoendopeptidase F